MATQAQFVEPTRYRRGGPWCCPVTACESTWRNEPSCGYVGGCAEHGDAYRCEHCESVFGEDDVSQLDGVTLCTECKATAEMVTAVDEARDLLAKAQRSLANVVDGEHARKCARAEVLKAVATLKGAA